MPRIIKALNILRLQLIKKLVPSGVFVKIVHPSDIGLKFFFDSNTDNGFILGFYEPELVRCLYNHLGKGSVFYDLGSAWGYFSLLASGIVGKTGKVYAFEPLGSNTQRIEQNLDKNMIDNVENFQYAISDKDDEVFFPDSEHFFSNSYLLTKSKSGVNVKCYQIDTLVSELGFRSPNFIKIDVEGAEYDVLKGGYHTIKKFRPVIYLSVHEFYDSTLKEKCDTFFKDLDYTKTVLRERDSISDALYLP